MRQTPGDDVPERHTPPMITPALSVTAAGILVMQKLAAQDLAIRRSKILLNRNRMPGLPLFFQAKANARMNGIKIITKLIGNPNGSPETG